MNERIEAMLHAEADSVEVAPYIPVAVRRRVRRRQGLTIGVASLALLGVAAAGFALSDQPSRLPPAGPERAATTERLAGGKVDGTPWRMEARYGHGPDGAAHESVCIVVPGRDPCWGIDGYAYGEANVALGYVKALDRIIVVVKAVPETDSVGLREISGTSWAALVASEGDVVSGTPAFFYRFFPPPKVEGVLTVAGADVPELEFSVKVNWPTVRTGVNVTADAFPELRGFEGDKRVVASGPEAGGYSVIMRTSESLVCLHMDDDFRCRQAEAPIEPIRLWIAQALECAPDDECAPGDDMIIITGEVGPDVAKIGIRDQGGTSFVQVGEPYGGGLFSSYVYGNAGDELELVAYDSSDNEIAVESVVVEDGT